MIDRAARAYLTVRAMQKQPGAEALQLWQCSGKGRNQELGLVERSQRHKEA